jgi:hypothetical protein
MMPLQVSPVDVRVVSPRRQPEGRIASRLQQATGLTLDEQGSLRRELAALDGDNARLASEVRRLQEENQDLRDAANLWIRLYERQLARANEAVQLAEIQRRK